ncbi:PEP-CTERM sorting domain-containing protein [Dapis sp. BLCC M229]|uniref:PEP-CTERM sorting domain-containing protein n=1 Tax=Dapis sp. BLCC M229 TaxID=3400188 RepID=UPI003CF1ACC5
MLKKLSIAAASATIATLTAVSGASAVSFSGAGFSIPDNDTAGISSSINITDEISVDDITVNLENLAHTWTGDLIATITHEESGTSVDLINRVGRTGGSGFGDSSDLSGNYSFNDSFTGDIWAVAAGVLNGDVVPGGDYFATTLDGTQSFLSDFTSLSSAVGTWTLFINDGAGGDTGSLGSWSVDIEGEPVSVSTPEPASLLALFGIGALGATSLKRKQKEEK